jgi:NTE family protein
MDNSKNKKVGLALGGGGAKGLAHIGVLKVLTREGVKIDYIAGTSIGSLMGAYYAAHLEVEELEKKILEKSDWKMGVSMFDPTLNKGILKGKRIEALIAEWIGVKTFQELQIPLTIITTDLKTGAMVNFSQGDIIKAIRASISVPLIFQPVRHDDMILTDGGLSNPVPDDVVAGMGADKVIAVNLDAGYFDLEGIEKRDMKIKDISLRSLNVLRYHLAKYCMQSADIIIEPELKVHGIVGWNNFFDREKAKKMIKQGEEKTEEMLPRIKASLK